MVILKFKKKLLDIYLSFTNWILENKFLFCVLIVYAISMLTVIDWGIPGIDHPFNYQMDEWHQLQAIKTTFKDFSANVPGSAHGTMLHFILSGLYLAPFYLAKIINPFTIKSSVEFLQVQQKLFEILRLNTLIFGLLSIFFIAKVAREHLKMNQNIVIILFAVTPLWMSLSNYFKYDIALVFWIIISLHYLLKFGSKPTLQNYLLAGVFCSLAVATKISALPLLIPYILSFFWFNKKLKLTGLLIGLLIFFIIFIFLGIPDLILGKGNWSEFLYSNLTSSSSAYGNLLTGFNSWWQYILLKIFPMDFGYGFFIIFVIGILYWIILFLKRVFNKRQYLYKNEFFLLFCFLLFLLSIIPLKLGANGNRLLVLLPFFALLSGAFLQRIKNTLINYKSILTTLFMLIFTIQFYQSIITVYVKWLPDVRQISSQWIEKNIEKGTLIGIENIPIYQLLPDIVVKDFYSKDRSYDYQIIDASSKTIPSLVIVTGKELDLNYLKVSAKKRLLRRLMEEEYKQIMEFYPPKILYLFAGNELNYSISGLAPISTISIFKKDK
ncbi:MAG: glycosyltransferase family 39 protein [Candidatus Levybacteria bacterium]|nr:glycosyltransferase family 39 protein [Candidatus Levybacteria bacterium]